MNKITFSVIIPTYNRAHVIERAINSVLNQTFNNFELIIVDDGSIDDTIKIIENIQDSRIGIIRHNFNKGQNEALNTGINASKGEYISFLDSDDEWLPSMLSMQYLKYCENLDYDCVYTQSGFILSDGSIKCSDRACILEGYIYKEALEQGYVTSPTTLSVKRNVAEKIKFDFLNKVCQDDMYCLKLAKYHQFGVVKDVLGIIHTDSGNQLTANLLNKAEDKLDIVYTFKDDIIQYCGYKVFSFHLMNVGVIYLQAAENLKAKNVFKIALQYNFNLKGFSYFLISLLPNIFYTTLLKLRTRLIKISQN